MQFKQLRPDLRLSIIESRRDEIKVAIEKLVGIVDHLSGEVARLQEYEHNLSLRMNSITDISD